MNLFRSIKRVVNSTVVGGIHFITPMSLVNVGKRLLHKDFMEAFSASMALIVTADGAYDYDEKEKIKAYIDKIKIVGGFSSEQVLPNIQLYVDILLVNRRIGTDRVHQRLHRIRRDADYCDTIVLTCIDIAKTDGEFVQLEKDVIYNICEKLHLDIKKYNLQ